MLSAVSRQAASVNGMQSKTTPPCTYRLLYSLVRVFCRYEKQELLTLTGCQCGLLTFCKCDVALTLPFNIINNLHSHISSHDIDIAIEPGCLVTFSI